MKGVERLAAAGLWILPALLVVLALYLDAAPVEPAPAPAAATGAQAFRASCAGCHTIGGGATVGPDLAGVSEWRPRDFIIRYTVEPDVMLAEGHPVALELAAAWPVRMPNLGLSRAQAERILEYIDQASAALAPPPDPGVTPPAEAALPAAPALVGEPGRGADLFTGRIRFANHGASCVSCHTAAGAGPFGGGTLARDLSDLHARLGDSGVTGVLGALTAFPLKAEIFQGKPLLDQEKADLLAFFQASAASTEPPPARWLYPAAGLAGLVLLLALTTPLALRGRPGVRRRLVEGTRRRGVER